MLYPLAIIKNISASTHSILGVQLAPNEEYTIPDDKRISIANNSTIQQKIYLDELQVGDGINFISDYNDQIDRLKANIEPIISVAEKDNTTGKIASTPQFAPDGYYEQIFELEFKTSTDGSIHEKDAENNDIGWASIRFFNSSGTELTPGVDDLNTTTITKLEWEPNIDYVIRAGLIAQVSTPNVPVYVWATSTDRINIPGVGDTPVAYKTFAEGGINMEFVAPTQLVGLDGVSGTKMDKEVEFDPVNYPGIMASGSNRIIFTVRHNAGFQHRFQLVFKIFVAG